MKHLIFLHDSSLKLSYITIHNKDQSETLELFENYILYRNRPQNSMFEKFQINLFSQGKQKMTIAYTILESK